MASWHLMMTLMLLLWGTGPAAAKDCPWEGDSITEVSASLTRVTVNRRTWSVRGRDNKERFHAWLVACQHGEAAKHFTTWRAARLGTNVSAVTLLGLFYTPFSAAMAGIARDDFVRALENDGSATPPAETDSEPLPEGLVSLPRPRVLAFYALSDDRIVRLDTPRFAAPALAPHFTADWAPYHTVEPAEPVLQTLDALVDDPDAAALAAWLREQSATWVGWHLERTKPDNGEQPSFEALAESPRALVFYALPTPQGPAPEEAEPLVLFAPFPTLKPLDPDVQPHLTIASRRWLERRLKGPAEAVDRVTSWLDEQDESYVGWVWEPRIQPAPE